MYSPAYKTKQICCKGLNKHLTDGLKKIQADSILVNPPGKTILIPLKSFFLLMQNDPLSLLFDLVCDQTPPQDLMALSCQSAHGTDL